MSISEQQVQRIGLFYLFAIDNEDTALSLAKKTVARIKTLAKRKGGGNVPIELNNARLVRILLDGYSRGRKAVTPKKPSHASFGSVVDSKRAEKVDLSIWTKFRASCSEEEFVCVLLAKVLQFNIQEIAEGQRLTIGTVVHRLAKGLGVLGESLHDAS